NSFPGTADPMGSMSADDYQTYVINTVSKVIKEAKLYQLVMNMASNLVQIHLNIHVDGAHPPEERNKLIDEQFTLITEAFRTNPQVDPNRNAVFITNLEKYIFAYYKKI